MDVLRRIFMVFLTAMTLVAATPCCTVRAVFMAAAPGRIACACCGTSCDGDCQADAAAARRDDDTPRPARPDSGKCPLCDRTVRVWTDTTPPAGVPFAMAGLVQALSSSPVAVPCRIVILGGPREQDDGGGTDFGQAASLLGRWRI